MNDIIESTVPEFQQREYDEVLKLVRDLSEGLIERDPTARPLERLKSPVIVTIEDDDNPLPLILGQVEYICRKCDTHFDQPPDDCSECGCGYFDRRRRE